MVEKRLRDHVVEMRRLSDHLVPYSYPFVDAEEEVDLLPLKTRRIIVDGYDLVVCFSKIQQPKFYIESLHITPACTPFLPFNLVCKIASVFLGTKHLSYIGILRHHKRIYCWSIRRRQRKVLPPIKGSQTMEYEGFSYNVLSPTPKQFYTSSE